jgi:hypothetical protein
VHRDGRITALEDLERNIGNVVEIGLAIDHGDVHRVLRVVADFLCRPEPGEVTAEDQDMGFAGHVDSPYLLTFLIFAIPFARP